MSLRKGAPTKEGPKHQNSFAFKHNKHSRKTEQIKAMPIAGVCKKCHDKLEWRKKYRKYKPLSIAAVCCLCNERNIKASYHKYCKSCACEKGVCPICIESEEIYISNKKKKAAEALDVASANLGIDKETIALLLKGETIPGVSERERRSMLRSIAGKDGVKIIHGEREGDKDSYEGEEGGEGEESYDEMDVEEEEEEDL